MLIRLAPYLPLHILEQPERALPITALRELLKHDGEVVEGELALEGVETPGDAATWREAAELVD